MMKVCKFDEHKTWLHSLFSKALLHGGEENCKEKQAILWFFFGEANNKRDFFSIYHTRYNLFHILPLSFFSSAIFESNICNELHRIAKKYFFEATTATAINVERVKLKSARSKISAVDSFLIGLLCHLMMKRASVCNRFFIVLYTYINSPFLFGHSHENGN